MKRQGHCAIGFSFGDFVSRYSMPPFVSSILLFLCLQLFLSGKVNCLHDDWYGFVSFEDAEDFVSAYSYTCQTYFDIFREPREFSQKDKLRGRRELHSPISFRNKDTKLSPENVTLHIYNSPGIRKGYSVSYGFQRNKECLHGQDSDCVVFPEVGRVRAVVMNAERFSGNENLNYIKDNFLIERPERFVTILNGGSIFERKFYEAVFLGGYTNDPTRTSHQIDGKKYPLEIYLYFLDETVPSVSLSTILVVLVEESDRDNPYIKPIINTIENTHYNKERRFLDRNKAMIRRERLFHNLQSSTAYEYNGAFDIPDLPQPREFSVLHDASDTSIKHEATFTRYVEPFEKMQALEAELFFLFEDMERIQELFNENFNIIANYNLRKENDYFAYNFVEYHILAYVAILWGQAYVDVPDRINETCATAVEDIIRNKKYYSTGYYPQFNETDKKFIDLDTTDPEHFEAYCKLVEFVCEYFRNSFTPLYNRNYKDQLFMQHISIDDKYEMINDLIEDRKRQDYINSVIYSHFHGKDELSGDKIFHVYDNTNAEPEYANPQQKFKVATGIQRLIEKREKRENYNRVQKELTSTIDAIVTRLEYASLDSMKEVIRYLKFGSKQNDLEHYRNKVHQDYVDKTLPIQRKKRSLVELGGMEIPDAEIEAYELLHPEKSIVNEAFQVSWLIPQDGGYYYYQGSSPIPPCFRAQNVIVFKRPITMSRRQIEILTRVPTSFDRSEDIRFTTPFVYDTKFEVDLSGSDTEKSRVDLVDVPIYNQPRNHLFLGHDGVHKNAVEEWDKISGRENKKSGATESFKMEGKLLGIVLVIITLVTFILQL